MLKRVAGQRNDPLVPVKHGFTSLQLIRDIKMKLKWCKWKKDRQMRGDEKQRREAVLDGIIQHVQLWAILNVW